MSVEYSQTVTLKVTANSDGYVDALAAKAAADERALASGEKLAAGQAKLGAAVEQSATRLKYSSSWWARAIGPIDEVARATHAYERKLKQLDSALHDGHLAQEALSRTEIALKRDLDAGRIGLEAYERQLQSVRQAYASGTLQAEEYARVKKLMDERYVSAGVKGANQILATQERQLTRLQAEAALAGKLPEERAKENAALAIRDELLARGVKLESEQGQQILANAEKIEALTQAARARVEAEANALKHEQEAARAAENRHKSARAILEAQHQRAMLSQLELRYVMADEKTMAAAIETLRLKNQLLAAGLALEDAEARVILGNLAHEQSVREKIQEQRAAKAAMVQAEQEAARVTATREAEEKRILATQERQLTLLQAEAALAGKLPEERAKALALLRAEQDLLSKGIDPASAAGAKILANAGEIDRLRQKIGGLGPSFEGVGRAAKLTRFQVLTLQYTINDVIASLGSGLSPMTILMQQGGQVTQAWGGIGATLRAAAAALGGLGIAIAGVSAAALAGFAASEAWRGEMRAMGLAARAGGGALGYTRDRLLDLGRTIAATAHLSDSEGRKIVAGLARARLGGEALAGVAQQARDFAALTGQDLPQASEALGRLFADPAKGARELDAAYGLLTAAERRHIEDLTDAGRKTEAQRLLADALGKRLRGLAEEDLGILPRAWHWTAAAASNAWDAMGRAFGPMTEIQNFKAEIQGLEEAKALALENGVSGKLSVFDDQIKFLQERIAKLQEEEKKTVEESAQSAKYQEELKWLEDINKTLDAAAEKRRQLNQEMERAYELAKQMEEKDPARAMAAREAFERMKSQRDGTLDPVQQAERAAERARDLGGLTGAQRALKQAEFETQDAIERGADDNERARLAAANRAKALAGLADASAQTMRALTQETAALLAEAGALGVSEAAARRAKIAAQAHSAALSGSIVNARDYAQALAENAAAQQLLASKQKTHELKIRAEDAKKLAEAELGGAAAVRAMALALEDEADARALEGLAAGKTLDDLKRELEERKKLRGEASAAAIQAKANQIQFGQQEDLVLLERELELAGQLPEAREREIELLRVKQQLSREGIDLEGEEGRKILENARNLGAAREKLRQRNREEEAQRKIWDNALEGIQSSFSNAFESILSGGVRTWKSLAASLRSVMMRTIAEIGTAMAFRPVLASALGGLGLSGIAQAAGLGQAAQAGGGLIQATGTGASVMGGGLGALNSYLFGAAASGNAAHPSSFVPAASGLLGAGGGLFGNSDLNIGTLGNAAGFALSAYNFANRPSIGSGLGLVGTGMGGLSALGVLGPAFGPIGLGIGLLSAFLGGVGQKTKHPGFAIELNNSQAGLALGRRSGKWMDTGGADDLGRAAIDGINRTVRHLTGGALKAGDGEQVYGLSFDASGGKQRYRAVGRGLSESVEYQTVAEAISAVTVAALKNLSLDGVAENVATALKKSTAKSLEEIKADIDFAKGFADTLALLKSGLDPLKSQAAEIQRGAREAAASLQGWAGQFREKAQALGQAGAAEVEGALRRMLDGALGLTTAAEPLKGYALAFEQAKAKILALKEVLREFGYTADETSAKLKAATEAARQRLAEEQNSALASEIRKLRDPKASDLAELEAWKTQAVSEAQALGNPAGMALIEELFGLRRQAIIEQYKNRIDGLTEAQQRAAETLARLMESLASRSLAVQRRDREKALYDFDVAAAREMAEAPADARAGLSRVLEGERAKLAFEAFQRDWLEAIDRQVRGMQEQKSATDKQISAIKAQTQATEGLMRSFEKFDRDLKLDPNLSILSTGRRREEAANAMDALYAKGMAGDSKALAEWEGLARQFLAISREYNASTPDYVRDYEKVRGQLDAALGRIRSPGQIAEDQLRALEAQSKQFDEQIGLLQQQRDQAARLGERQLESLEALRAGTLEALARLEASQAGLAHGISALAGAMQNSIGQGGIGKSSGGGKDLKEAGKHPPAKDGSYPFTGRPEAKYAVKRLAEEDKLRGTPLADLRYKLTQEDADASSGAAAAMGKGRKEWNEWIEQHPDYTVRGELKKETPTQARFDRLYMMEKIAAGSAGGPDWEFSMRKWFQEKGLAAPSQEELEIVKKSKEHVVNSAFPEFTRIYRDGADRAEYNRNWNKELEKARKAKEAGLRYEGGDAYEGLGVVEDLEKNERYLRIKREREESGKIRGYAAGGRVGNGAFNRDSVLARYGDGGAIALAGGEFVVTAPAVNEATLPLLQAINRSGQPPELRFPPPAAAPPISLAPLLSAVRDLAERLEILIDIAAASGDRTTAELSGVRAALGAVARETALTRLVANG